MLSFARVLLLSICSTMLPDGAIGAQDGSLSLRNLARRWSGSSVTPSCTANVQQQRDGVPRVLTTSDCVWPARQNGPGQSRVTGIRSPLGALQLVTLSEDVADRSAAFRMRDSLSVTLRQQGFAEYQCYEDDRQWRSSRAAVHFFIGATFPNGLLRVGVAATTEAKSMPDIACPDSSATRLH
jgi:hypothetical protein